MAVRFLHTLPIARSNMYNGDKLPSYYYKPKRMKCLYGLLSSLFANETLVDMGNNTAAGNGGLD